MNASDMNDSRLVPVVCLLASVLIGATGQILLKQGMSALGPLTLAIAAIPRLVRDMARNGRLLLGGGFYALSAALWLYALSQVDLSYAYPLLALHLILVALGAHRALGERFTALRWTGILLIAAGIALVMAS